MSETVILDDELTFREIHGAATLLEALVPPQGSVREARKRLEEAVAECLRKFDHHRGFGQAPAEGIPDVEQKLLKRSLDVIGLQLGLETALPVFERVVETDWLAHLDLAKEKRYRDHITHPTRVTAIGLWLLHRDDQSLLTDLAEHYERSTRAYVQKERIDLQGRSWKEIVRFAWLAAGLLHDSAYPMEYHLRAGERLGHPLCDALGLCATAAALRSQAGRNRLVAPLRGSWFASQKLGLEVRLAELPGHEFKHAHALLGALNHLHKLGGGLRSLQGLVVQMAARAIVTHHDPEETAIVSDPLAFLLYVADNLQMWKRPFLLREARQGLPGHAIRPLIECDRIELQPDGGGYLARFWMNPDPRDMEVLKSGYGWHFEAFRKPNLRLQELIARHGKLPSIRLAEPDCILPEPFFAFMKV